MSTEPGQAGVRAGQPETAENTAAGPEAGQAPERDETLAAGGSKTVPDQAEDSDGRPATAEPVMAGPATDAEPGPADGRGEQPTIPDPPAGPASRLAGGAAEAGLDGPLLGDAAGLRASWHRIQAGFVDDPREAVADAANLVEHTAQALVGALRQRQRRLRGMWDDVSWQQGGGSRGTAQPRTGDAPDTEQLRLMLRRYRVLFDEICQPPG